MAEGVGGPMNAAAAQTWEAPWRSTTVDGRGKAGYAPTYLYTRAIERRSRRGPQHQLDVKDEAGRTRRKDQTPEGETRSSGMACG